jgi:hypothetical protein
MTFNIHITRIGETTSGDVHAQSVKRTQNQITAKNQKPAPSLVNVPTDHQMNKYPVRIFELQTQE